jgi:hypothetical protein
VSASSDALQNGLDRADWRSIDLWQAALGTGGDFSRHDVEAFLDGNRVATGAEHDILAAALNDHFVDRHDDHPVHYWRELDL